MKLTLKMTAGAVHDMTAVLKKHQYFPEIPQLRVRVHYRHFKDGTRFFLESSDMVIIEGEDAGAIEMIRNISTVLLALGWRRCRILSGSDKQKEALLISALNLDIEVPEEEKRIASLRGAEACMVEITPEGDNVMNEAEAGMVEITSEGRAVKNVALADMVEITPEEVKAVSNDLKSAEGVFASFYEERKEGKEDTDSVFSSRSAGLPVIPPVLSEGGAFINFESMTGTLRLEKEPEILQALSIIKGYFDKFGFAVPELEPGVCRLQIQNRRIISLNFQISIK